MPWDATKATPSLEVVYGSRLYGTHRETSDYDSVGFVIPPSEYRLGLYNSDGSRMSFKTLVSQTDENDRTIHDAEKFIRLLVKGNVTAIEVVFAAACSKNVIHLDTFGIGLVEDRHKFLSKQLYPIFRGFAKSELRKAFGETAGALGVIRKEALAKHGYSPTNAYQCIRLLDEGRRLLCEGDIQFPFLPSEVAFYQLVRDGTLDPKVVRALIEEKINQLDRANDVSFLPDHPDYVVVNWYLKSLDQRA